MSDIPKLPKGAPKRVQRIYVWIVSLAVILGAITYCIRQIPPLAEAAGGMCRDLYVCSPAPLKDMQPLASGFENGNTVARAARAQFEQYGRENPDWDICIKDTRSISTHDAFNTNFRYRMEGTFYGVPKWRGLIELIGDYLSGRPYVKQPCQKG